MLHVSGKFSKVLRSRCENGIKVVEFSDPKQDDPVFRFDPATNETFGSDALVPEPLDSIMVTTGRSELTVAGDGVFAAVDIPDPET